MITMKEQIFRNKITQDLFRIKEVENGEVVMLEDDKGFVQIWLPKAQIGAMFEKIGGE